jgi:hypothetical protein
MRGYLGQMASLMGWSSLPLLASIELPTLVIAGDDDPLTPVANGVLIAYMLPQGRLLVMPGEGHLMALDPDSGAQPAIREFLAAPRLDRAPVWQRASVVGQQALEQAFRSTGWQSPPWAVISARQRRRWVASGRRVGRAAPPELEERSRRTA